MFYIENFALRLLFCVGTCLAAVLIASFIRFSAAGQPFVFDPMRHLLMPLALGGLAAFMWKPSQK